MYVATIDIPCDFIHAGVKQEVNIKLEVTTDGLFSNIYPQNYTKSVTMEMGRSSYMLYPRKTYM